MSMPGVAAVKYVTCAVYVQQFLAELIHTYWIGAILPGYIYRKSSFVLCILDGVTDL
jgi:hypothetical protein